MTEEKMELEDARKLVATLARQLEISEMSGKWNLNELVQYGGEIRTEEQIKFCARLFREALYTVLRAAGLSTDWH